MHRVKVIMTYGTPDYHYPGSIEACERFVQKKGGTLQYHCPKHNWVVGRRCPSCYREGIG